MKPSHFETFGEVLRPWGDADSIRDRFVAWSRDHHPDRMAGRPEEAEHATDRFSRMNEAAKVLADARLRLVHFLEVVRGGKMADVQKLPLDLEGLFMEVGRLNRELDAFLKDPPDVSVPLVRAMTQVRLKGWTESLERAENQMTTIREKVLIRVKELDAQGGVDGQWDAVALNELEGMARVLGYLDRWEHWMREKKLALSLLKFEGK